MNRWEKFSHMLHSSPWCCINLEEINTFSLLNRYGWFTFIAWLWSWRVRWHAIEALCKESCNCCLAYSSSSTKQEGLMHSFLLNTILNYLDNMVLTNDFIEGIRSIFSCKNLIRHKYQIITCTSLKLIQFDKK